MQRRKLDANDINKTLHHSLEALSRCGDALCMMISSKLQPEAVDLSKAQVVILRYGEDQKTGKHAQLIADLLKTRGIDKIVMSCGPNDKLELLDDEALLKLGLKRIPKPDMGDFPQQPQDEAKPIATPE